MRRLLLPIVPLLGVLLLGAGDETCRPEVPRLDRDAYLRALSLDLRGVPPTVEEHEAIAAEPDVPEALIDEWLASEEFAARAVRRHRALIWPAIDNVRLVHFRRRLGTAGSASAGTLRYYRGSVARDIRIGNVACADEPATFDAEGRPVFRDDGMGNRVEGWVEVAPYWAPGTTIRVCAADAMQNRTSRSGRDCASRESVSDTDCGCGPGLAWCDTGATHAAMVDAFEEDVLRRLAAHFAADEPYSAIFTSRRAFVNGPMVFYYRNLARIYDSLPLLPAPIDVEHLPDLDYVDTDTWVEIDLPEGHAGILTSVVYLLRFQTNRARANRFYDAFLCQPFQPPNGGLPVADEVEQRQSDLQQRAGCRYCHAILEPAAAHWGRWTQQGGGYLDEVSYPSFRPECADCARGDETCSDTCRLHYVTRALSSEEERYLGMLRSYEWLRPEHEGYVAEGPQRLVLEGLGDGRFTSCAVRRTSEWLLGRELEDRDATLTSALEAELASSELRYRDLVRAVVTSDTYRRVR